MSSIVTFTGKHFDYLDPQPDQIDIIDIGVALSREGRFAGHCSQFYSVSQHCVLASEMIVNQVLESCPDKLDEKEIRRYSLLALFHDAAEAYMRDIPSPLKDLLPEYKNLEQQVLFAICSKFGLQYSPSDLGIIHIVDKRMLTTEMRKFIPKKAWWPTIYEPYSKDELTIEPWSSDSAAIKFLARYHELQDDS